MEEDERKERLRMEEEEKKAKLRIEKEDKIRRAKAEEAVQEQGLSVCSLCSW